MGQSSSTSDTPLAEDQVFEEEEDEDDVTEDPQEEDGARPSEGGFNMVFSPELVKRLQGEGREEEQEEEAQKQQAQQDQGASNRNDSPPPMSSNNGMNRRQYEHDRIAREYDEIRQREEQRRHYVNMARQEHNAVTEIQHILSSVDTAGNANAEQKQTKNPCESERKACMDCLNTSDSMGQCTELVKQFNDCVYKSQQPQQNK